MRLPFHLANYVLVRSPFSGLSGWRACSQLSQGPKPRSRGQGPREQASWAPARDRCCGAGSTEDADPAPRQGSSVGRVAPRSARHRLETRGLEVRSACLAPENLPFCTCYPTPTHQMAREGIAGTRLHTQTLPSENWEVWGERPCSEEGGQEG